MPFSPEGKYHCSDRQEYIHGLISEFRERLIKEGYEITISTDGIAVLSSPVSLSYHVPRVACTALVNLDAKRGFDVIGVPLDRVLYNVYKKIRGEVKRIVAYSVKGDIAK